MNTPPAQSWKQIAILFAFVLIYALLASSYYVLLPPEGLTIPGYTQETSNLPRWLLGLAIGGIVLVVYSLAGLAGFWFARRLGLPGTFRPGAGWRSLFIWPLLIGLLLGILFVAADRAFTPAVSAAMAVTNPEIDWQGFPHPEFPQSIIASATAGIGEEILFRSFVLGLWTFILNLILRRWNGTNLARAIGNLIAALAFAASHLPAAMLLTGTATPAELPIPLLIELITLNGAMGLAAGERYFRDGLVAAIGVHFWADIIWHVLAPLSMG